ncbi:hypothetical protein ACFQ1S_05645 [Kibdelosporangium lantanae]|uniref:Uncharacterized protein n=1 Tax=Kibdelosporangium lantanae TaxID=1497396 RepID=A0ABW3M5H1_9PSEU
MDKHLASTLADAVYQRLTYLDKLVANGDVSSKAALADTEIYRLTVAWRRLLGQHQPDKHGRCPQCSGWWLRRRHPCSVWTTAHKHLIVADAQSSSGLARYASPASQPPRG